MGVLKPNVATGLAASLGLAQGVIWSNMALICIVMYNAHPYNEMDIIAQGKRIKRRLAPSSYDDTAAKSKSDMEIPTRPTGYLIWKYIIQAPSSKSDDEYSPTFNGSLFNAFVWIHFILHVIWLIVSVCILTKMGEKKRMAQIWCILTAIIFLWDFVTSCIIMDDHRRCTKEFKDAYDKSKQAATGNGRIKLTSEVEKELDKTYNKLKKPCDKSRLTVLTITSKIFFVLWIINAFLAFELWTSYGPKIDILQH